MYYYFTYHTYRVCKQGGLSVVGVLRHLWLLILIFVSHLRSKLVLKLNPKLRVGGARVFEGFWMHFRMTLWGLRYSRRLLCIIILHTIPIGFVSRVASL